MTVIPRCSPLDLVRLQGEKTVNLRVHGNFSASPGHSVLSGHGEQTSVETDGGNLIKKTITHHNSGGTALK
ncbi:hypothetical protein [Streptomyces graminofaciens]|uniref:hypothetical protein n=1 Tax=Streptomyces graminofaciens TaxID=68212 RepID=UPI0025747E71|nr:hypothetical protein [Streptomyces graminofaciens]